MQGALRRNRERGIALLAVVAVLVLLAIIATPFLVTMRDGAQRGKALLASSEAEMEAENVLHNAVVQLGATDTGVETYARAQSLKTQPATPEYDTLAEFQVNLLAGAGADPDSGRLWGTSVEDESAKINVNSAPFTLLGHFLGITLLADGLDADAREIAIATDGGLPAEKGVVRLGDEVVFYQKRDGTVLRGCQRGYLSDRPGNGPARKHGKGEIVVNEVAFQIAAYPILARRGKFDGAEKTEFAPYANLYELRRISDLGVAALSAEQWDRMADSLTVSSRGVVGQTFGDPQSLREPVKAGQDGHKAHLKIENPLRYGIGTIVRVSDATHTDYGVVFGVGGGAYVDVVPALQHDYEVGVTRVESLIRQPVNINTASEQVLTAMHSFLCRQLSTPIAPDVAGAIAKRLILERNKEREDKLPPGITGLKEYRDILHAMAKEGTISPADEAACGMNALNPLDTASTRLAVGSVPVDVRSGGIFTVTARAVVLDRTGREAGRRDFRRVVDVSPQGTTVYEIGGQADLDEVLRATNAKWFTTYPVNLGFEERGGAMPPSRYTPFFVQGNWASTDRTDPAASLRLAASRLSYGPAGANFPEPKHFDNARYTEGQYMDKGDETFGTSAGTVAIAGDAGMEAFSAALWFKPFWGGRRTAFVLDSGMEEWEDRVVLFYDGEKAEMVFRVKDTSTQHIAAEVRYPFDKSTWEDDRWYHLHVSASGSRPDQISMIIDGVKRGSPSLLTWTTENIDTSTNVTSLRVEDAASFPERGSVLLRGPNGVEVMEYDGRSSNAFTVTRRYARMNRADVVDDSSKTIVRSFPSGTTVQLHGYSIPVTSIIPEGGGELASALGRFNVLVLNSKDQNLAKWPNPQTGGGGAGVGTGGGGSSLPTVATGWRTDGDTLTLNLQSDVSGWNGKSGIEASAAFGGEGGQGYALLVCTDDPLPSVSATPYERLGGTEVVAYRVSGGNIVLTRGVQPPPNIGGVKSKYYIDRSGGERPFIPKHTYGEKNDPLAAFIKQQQLDPDGRLYLDDAIPEVGIISMLVPISVEVSSADANTFLQAGTQRDFTPRSLYAQINTLDGAEWIKYDSVVLNTQVSSNVLLVRDRTADRLAALFRSHQFTYTTAPTTTPPVPPDTPPSPPGDPPPGGEGDGGGGPPDAPPAPPGGGGEDDGPPSGTPDTPPAPPSGGGEDDGPPSGGGDTPPPPSGDGGEDDGPGGDPDTPPPPSGDGGEDDGPPSGGGDTPPGPPTPVPPDDGGTPPDDGGSPPDTGGGSGTPSPGGGSGVSGPGGTSTTVVPFNSGGYPHFVARFLDFRSTGDQSGTTAISTITQPADVPVLIADISAFNGKTSADKTHAQGTQVLPCFLVAFPGIEYDPEGDGLVVEMDLDELVRQNKVEVLTGSPGGSSVGGAGAGGADKGYMAATAAALVFGKTGDSVEPGSAGIIGPYVQTGPGFGDEVTLVRPDPDGARETHIVNWSHRSAEWTARYDYLNPSNGGFRRSWTWVAFREPTEERWTWNYDRFSGTSAKTQASDLERYVTGAMADQRTFVRLVKAPSGEMPSRTADFVHVGANWGGEQFAKAVVDEVRFTSRRSVGTGPLVNPRTFRLGQVPVAGSAGKGITAQESTIHIHAFEAYAGSTTPSGIRGSGGIMRLDDELIGYSDYDASSQTFTGCERGAIGSEAREHDYGSDVSFVQGIGVSRLEEGMSATSPRIPLADSHGFPIWGGFVRIGEEILGYTRIDPNGVLEMPEGRQLKSDGKFDPYADTNQGAGLFRARYGTAALAHEQGSLVYHLDHRYPDFARDAADHPQLASYEVSRNVKGALWKRVSWDQRLRSLNGIRVVVRFEGGPAWDSDKIVRLDSDTMPESDRRAYLYEIKDPRKLNLLDVQSDRIECRVFFTYEKGAWNTAVTPSADAWKETPWLKAFRIEYAAPSGVLTTEDLR